MNTDRTRAHFPSTPRKRGLREGLGEGLSKASLLAAPLLLAACASVPPITEQPGDAAFGEANRQTMMAQVVNPDPVYDEPMVTSGEHAQQAIERYATDSVKQPESISTTETIGGGGGGGGSN
jgi:hypothetical protein